MPFALAAVLGIQPVMAAPYRLSVPSGYTSPFIDVQSGDWYYKYVAVLNSQGMIDGYGDGRFGPNDTLTSGAALVMVLKAAGSGTIAPSGAHWASGYADYAVEQGYLTREEIGDLGRAHPPGADRAAGGPGAEAGALSGKVALRGRG